MATPSRDIFIGDATTEPTIHLRPSLSERLESELVPLRPDVIVHHLEVNDTSWHGPGSCACDRPSLPRRIKALLRKVMGR